MKNLSLLFLALLVVTGQAWAGIIVSSSQSSDLHEYDADTGALIRTWTGSNAAHGGLAGGPDGLLYTTRYGASGAIVRYDPTTGTYLDTFSSGASLANSFNLVFGPDGHIYASEYHTGNIRRFDGTTGASLGIFANTGSGRTRELEFGPDGYLYAVNEGNPGSVVRIDPVSGANLGNFTSGVSMRFPHGISWGADDNLYVSDFSNDRIVRFDGSTGAFMDVFISGAGLDGPVGLEFGLGGDLFVASWYGNEIRRYSAVDGSLVNAFSTSVNYPYNLTFVDFSASESSVPLPATLGLMFLGLAAIRSRQSDNCVS